jgi:hypothetical protein
MPHGDNLLHNLQKLLLMPTHLHSHLLLLNFNFLMEEQKQKRVQATAPTTDKLGQTDKDTEKRRAGTNST